MEVIDSAKAEDYEKLADCLYYDPYLVNIKDKVRIRNC